MSNEPMRLLAPLVAFVGFCAASLYVLSVGHPHEDAYILFIFSESFASGEGIRYFPGGPPAEGATDFLWMISLGVLKFLGLDVAVAATILNGVGLAIIAGAIQSFTWMDRNPWHSTLVGGAFAVLLVLSPIATASYAGFSTAFYSAGTAVVFLILFHGREKGVLLLPLVGLVVGLIRPDGVLIGCAAALLGVIYAYKSGYLKTYLAICLFSALLGAAYFVWRYDYFGHLLPLPLYVKSADALSLPGLEPHILWAESNWLLGILSGLGFMSLKGSCKARVLCASVPVVVLFVALVFATQSQNYDYRLQAPGLTVVFLVLGLGVARLMEMYALRSRRFSLGLATCLGFGLGLFFTNASLAKASVEYLARTSYINVFPYLLAKHIPESATIALTEAGRMAYWTPGKKYDLVGLNTAEIAITKVSPSYLLNLTPDIIFIHAAGTIRSEELCAAELLYCETSIEKILEALDTQSLWSDVPYGVIRAPLAVYEFARAQGKNYTIYAVKYRGRPDHLYLIKNNGKIGRTAFVEDLDDAMSLLNVPSYFQLKAM